MINYLIYLKAYFNIIVKERIRNKSSDIWENSYNKNKGHLGFAMRKEIWDRVNKWLINVLNKLINLF